MRKRMNGSWGRFQYYKRADVRRLRREDSILAPDNQKANVKSTIRYFFSSSLSSVSVSASSHLITLAWSRRYYHRLVDRKQQQEQEEQQWPPQSPSRAMAITRRSLKRFGRSCCLSMMVRGSRLFPSLLFTSLRFLFVRIRSAILEPVGQPASLLHIHLFDSC